MQLFASMIHETWDGLWKITTLQNHIRHP